ncbi:hypothetical protein [Bradyrhizobium monzae]|uniref:hypothetical protein n=1 Tax=Bradyrhizobium sp. Oc8 TaxID=2876780 RepID=UPI001F3E712F|nr:hypothetical protein [Bradyrhizobium sp. Oc8]
MMPLSQRQVCVPAADGDAVQPALAAGCAVAAPINTNVHARAQNPARQKPLMPASVCMLGTVQGDVDTVPYHAQRLLKSAGVFSYFALRQFPDRRNQLSVMAPCRVSALRAMWDVGAAAVLLTSAADRTSLAQRFPAIFRILITTKTTWLVRLEMRSETSADRAEPAENYG